MFNVDQLQNKKNGKQANIWNLKSKFFPKNKSNIPVAKTNLANQIITNPLELKRVYVNHFKHRMRLRPILPEYESYGEEVERKFNTILMNTKKITHPDWTMKDLETVLKSLKQSQSHDTMGLVNEIFMLHNIGEDLKMSLLCTTVQ